MIEISRTKAKPGHFEHHLLIDLGKPCQTLASTVLGGGFRQARYIINRSVDKTWYADNPTQDMRRYARHLGLAEQNCIGFITAVSMDKLQSSEFREAEWRVKSFVSAGTGNASRAGGQNPWQETQTGTINIIVIVFGKLSPAAMIAAVQTATEAKTAALEDAQIVTGCGEKATGTSSDAIAIVNYCTEPKTNYAGLATPVGYALGQSVYKATLSSLSRRL